MPDPPLSLQDLAAIGVERLSGVGPRKLKGLVDMEIESMLDLLCTYPRRYIDRTRQVAISGLGPGDEAMVVARVADMTSRRVKGGRVMVSGRIADDSGSLRVSFFNQAWRERQLPAGTDAVFFGKVDDFRGTLQLTNPVVDVVGDRTGRIVPVYPQSEKSRLSTWDIGTFCAQVLRRCEKRGILDPVPEAVRLDLDLMDRGAAFEGIHQPESMAQSARARRRLAFDELLRIQLTLVQAKRDLEARSKGIVHDGDGHLVDAYLARLPFPLTAAQHRCIGHIAEDMERSVPMHRLLQGDVGAGKTVVAVTTLLRSVSGGHQAAFMAPTEVLAEQHMAGLSRDLSGLEITDLDNLFGLRELRVELLTNRVSGADRRRILSDLADRRIDIVVGTHALIQEGVDFSSLGAVVIDEQHRFGVEQRAALRAANPDGTVPDVLVMTATPIPRTAAMTVYGDLDVSVLDQLPPGRTPIVTTWLRHGETDTDPWADVIGEVKAGRQVYVVCPLIDESEALDVASASEVASRLAAGPLGSCRVGLLHGRLPMADKDEVMGAFRAGQIDVLVATTVIEVGVDVPNATMMVVLDADRFGIAQLHQLRGRVGRGDAASRCVLVAADPTPDGVARLEALEKSTDGFELAEVDLDLRGEGTILGERQKGRNDLRLASLRRDRELVALAREVAFDLVGDGSGLEAHPELRAEMGLFFAEEDEEFLMKN